MDPHVDRDRTRVWLRTLGPLLGLIVVWGIFAVTSPETFITAGNFQTMARQMTIVGTASLGMTLIIIMGGIDLSVGSIIALTTVVTALFLQMGWGPMVSALGAVAAAGTCGLVTGVLVTRIRVVPFIVSLGMLLLLRGAAKGLANEQKIDAPLTWLAQLMASLTPETAWLVVPPGVWIMVLAAVTVTVLLYLTRFGRHVFAIGSNEQTARLCGVPVERVKTLVYAAGAVFTGIAGLMQFSRLSVGDPTVASGAELDIIAAVVIGGGSLSGGEGSVLGSLIGAAIMTVIRAGCSHLGIPNWIQEMLTGLIIVVAVALDRLRRRRAGA